MCNFWRYIDKLIWTRHDEDWVYGYQCVDFAREVAQHLWYPIASYGDAYKIWLQGSAGYEKKIPWSYIPLPWDIIFSWPTPKNKAGHIMIADIGCTMARYNIIDQNGWRGSWTGKWVDAITRRMKTAQQCCGIFARNKPFTLKP